MHRHPGADKILFLQNGTARVTLADSSKEVHGGATVFIPANTWISMTISKRCLPFQIEKV
jgi:quercetin dioxygenase-like cupin family protein